VIKILIGPMDAFVKQFGLFRKVLAEQTGGPPLSCTEFEQPRLWAKLLPVGIEISHQA
jgi:hypothetical protein